MSTIKAMTTAQPGWIVTFTWEGKDRKTYTDTATVVAWCMAEEDGEWGTFDKPECLVIWHGHQVLLKALVSKHFPSATVRILRDTPES
ncbi:hypothetical protein [Amycolatopsis pithecellobii]|uniref:Uncharacterized protein n=1 Tax=Amycolatopsis pithecellobii TaxID=664692 RepID=A0A6N7YRN8_9PSEU|nr:hypothetical protein [Amycolatopsis pithecellobii]MTD55697.1 hypothetical protein [Amycolatopsis pithecellobii]